MASTVNQPEPIDAFMWLTWPIHNGKDGSWLVDLSFKKASAGMASGWCQVELKSWWQRGSNNSREHSAWPPISGTETSIHTFCVSGRQELTIVEQKQFTDRLARACARIQCRRSHLSVRQEIMGSTRRSLRPKDGHQGEFDSIFSPSPTDACFNITFYLGSSLYTVLRLRVLSPEGNTLLPVCQPG
ncbi:hypothetical protein BC830DRAFT_504778 [Chytriomyces sp. MP71]|nr:hypothetical protein BC830DRAFT_504778 [Chytriomyces sp. MP71]